MVCTIVALISIGISMCSIAYSIVEYRRLRKKLDAMPKWPSEKIIEGVIQQEKPKARVVKDIEYRDKP